MEHVTRSEERAEDGTSIRRAIRQERNTSSSSTRSRRSLWRAYKTQSGNSLPPPSLSSSSAIITTMSSFLPLYKTSPVDEHPHSLASSIWAPQPQPLEATWPRTMTSFPSDAEENKLRLAPEPRRVVSLSGFTPQPDIFGPFAPTHPRQRPVGAIGDGRLKDDSDIAHTVSFWSIYAPLW